MNLKRRVFAKTITYKLASYLSGVAIIGGITGNWGLATGVSLVLLGVNTGLYILHEVIWNGIEWGKTK